LRARWTKLSGSMRPLSVVVHGVGGEHSAQVSFPEDQHLVGEFGADGQHNAFGKAVRSWTPGRDLDHLDPRVRQDRVERGRELSGSIADEEPEPGDVFAEVRDEVAGLLSGPGPRRDARSRPGRAGSGRRPRARTGRRGAAASPGSRRERNRSQACWWPACAGTAARWCRCAGPVPVGSGGAGGSYGLSRRRPDGRA
jgi:hypothetical protein